MMMMNNYRDTTARIYALFASEPATRFTSDELAERFDVTRRAVQKALKILLADNAVMAVAGFAYQFAGTVAAAGDRSGQRPGAVAGDDAAAGEPVEATAAGDALFHREWKLLSETLQLAAWRSDRDDAATAAGEPVEATAAGELETLQDAGAVAGDDAAAMLAAGEREMLQWVRTTAGTATRQDVASTAPVPAHTAAASGMLCASCGRDASVEESDVEYTIYTANILEPRKPQTKAYYNVVAVRRVASGYRAMIVNAMPPVYVTGTFLEPEQCQRDAERNGYLVVELQ